MLLETLNDYLRQVITSMTFINESFVFVTKSYLNNFFNMGVLSIVLMFVMFYLLQLMNASDQLWSYETNAINTASMEIGNRINKLINGRMNIMDHRHFAQPPLVKTDLYTDDQDKFDELLFVLDRNGYFLYANKKTLWAFNTDLHQIMSSTVFDVYEEQGNIDFSWFDDVRKKSQSSQLLKVLVNGEDKLFLVNYKGNLDSLGEFETIMANGTDVTFLKNSETIKDLYYSKDPLTGLITQQGMFEQIRNLKNVTSGVAFFIKALGYSEICNYYGDETGNALLNAIAEELQMIFSTHSLIVRYNESKFVVICTATDICKDSLKDIIAKLNHFSMSSYEIGELNLQIEKGIGYAVYPEDTMNLEETVSLAGIALKEALNRRTNEVVRFNPEMKEHLVKNIQIANKLRDALDEQLIEVYFQKAIDCSTNEVFVIEELSRWKDQEMGYIPPDVFFQVAKETNQLHRLDSYMVKKSLDSFAKLREKKEYQKAKLTINITPTTLLDKNFFDYFNELVDSHSMSHDDIFIEISETTFINNHNICLERINQFKEKGYLIALDDFGTEYSSLSILEIVDFDIIKIDAHFVQNIDKFNNKEIIKMIRTITSRISKEIVAEGVETKAQSEALVELGCQIQQGYFLHRPENLLQY